TALQAAASRTEISCALRWKTPRSSASMASTKTRKPIQNQRFVAMCVVSTVAGWDAHEKARPYGTVCVVVVSPFMLSRPGARRALRPDDRLHRRIVRAGGLLPTDGWKYNRLRGAMTDRQHRARGIALTPSDIAGCRPSVRHACH